MNLIDSIRLDFPDTWQQVPIDRAELNAMVTAVQETDEWKGAAVAQRRMLELFLQRFLADVEGSGVLFAALYYDTPDSGGDELADPTVACAVVSLLTAADIGSKLPLTPHVLQAAMSATKDLSATAGTRSTNLSIPQIVPLPCGTGVRVRRLVEQQVGKRATSSFYTDTYFVPLPQSAEQLMVLQFATPHIGDEALFTEYFAALAETVRFYREGETTTL